MAAASFAHLAGGLHTRGGVAYPWGRVHTSHKGRTPTVGVASPVTELHAPREHCTPNNWLTRRAGSFARPVTGLHNQQKVFNTPRDRVARPAGVPHTQQEPRTPLALFSRAPPAVRRSREPRGGAGPVPVALPSPFFPSPSPGGAMAGPGWGRVPPRRGYLSGGTERRCRQLLAAAAGGGGAAAAGAAVLVPLCSVRGRPSLLYTLRCRRLPGPHSGDVR